MGDILCPTHAGLSKGRSPKAGPPVRENAMAPQCPSVAVASINIEESHSFPSAPPKRLNHTLLPSRQQHL
jgi:hypothetical protein